MALARRTGQRRDVSGAIWPGFVDAMTALLLVLMFVLSIFMIVQFVLRDTISAQDTRLEDLGAEVAALADALGLSRAQVASLEEQVSGLGAELQAAQALAARRAADLDQAQSQITDFEARVAALLSARDDAEARSAALSADLAQAQSETAQALSDREALDLALADLRDARDAEAEAARLAALRAEAVEAALAEARAEAAASSVSLAQLAASLLATQEELATQRGETDAAEAEVLAERAAAEALRAQLGEAEAALSAEERARLADAAASEALRRRLETADAELSAMTLALEEERRRAEETLSLLAAARDAEAEAEAAREAEISERARIAALRNLAETQLAVRDAQTLADQRRIEALNQQVAELRAQVGGLQDLLGAARARDEDAQTRIESLGADLNLALAQLASEERRRAEREAAERARLERFQSEFFGQLRDVLEGRDGVEIVGDRFVFSSEVLFELGSADLAAEGRAQIGNVVAILSDVADRIPPEIDWILQVEGHTDNLPIGPGGAFADNWALSQARALSVVRYLTEERGFPAQRLSAAGFGEYRPVDPANTPEARSRNRRIELKLTER